MRGKAQTAVALLDNTPLTGRSWGGAEDEGEREQELRLAVTLHVLGSRVGALALFRA